MTARTDWMATADEHHDLTEADIADLSRPRFVRPDADPMERLAEENRSPAVIVYLFAAVYGFLAISAAVLCKLGWVG